MVSDIAALVTGELNKMEDKEEQLVCTKVAGIIAKISVAPKRGHTEVDTKKWQISTNNVWYGWRRR